MNSHYDEESLENAEEIIERFGGIRPMANKMNVPVTTVQGWKKRNVIPANRRDEVLEAAQENNIDIADLAAANENTAQPSSVRDRDETQSAVRQSEHETRNFTPNAGQNFESEVKQDMARPDPAREQKHREAVLAASLASEGAIANNEAFIRNMHEMNRNILQKSVLFSVILVAAAIGLSAVLIWPDKSDVAENGQRIGTVETQVAEVQTQQNRLRNMIPENFRAEFDTLQQQTQAVRAQVQTITERAGEISNDVMAPGLSLNERVGRLEEQVAAMGGPTQLSAILQKLQELQSTAQGQALLQSSMSELNNSLTSLQGRVDNMDETIAAAKTEKTALNETLEGVPQDDLKAASMLLALAQFRSSLNRSTPFEEDLAVMQKLLGNDDPELQAAITKLAPKSAEGVLTPQGLQNELRAMAGDIVMASLQGEDVSIREQAAARLNNVLQVEKDGELITGTDTQAKIARAQRMLDEGNVEGALAELQSLEGGAAQTAQPLIQNAEMTLLAGKLEEMFGTRVANEVAQSGLSSSLDGMQSMSPEQILNKVKNIVPGTMVRDESSGFEMYRPGIALPQ